MAVTSGTHPPTVAVANVQGRQCVAWPLTVTHLTTNRARRSTTLCRQRMRSEVDKVFQRLFQRLLRVVAGPSCHAASTTQSASKAVVTSTSQT